MITGRRIFRAELTIDRRHFVLENLRLLPPVHETVSTQSALRTAADTAYIPDTYSPENLPYDVLEYSPRFPREKRGSVPQHKVACAQDGCASCHQVPHDLWSIHQVKNSPLGPHPNSCQPMIAFPLVPNSTGFGCILNPNLKNRCKVLMRTSLLPLNPFDR